MALPAILPLLSAIPSVLGAIKDVFSSKPSAPALGKDDFLNLLVAQLQSAGVKGPVISTVRGLGNALNGGGAGALSSVTALINEPVTATAASFTYTGAAVNLPYDLSQPIGSAGLQILDASGNVVAQVPLGAKGTGPGSIALSSAIAGALPPGSYRYQIVSLDPSGRATPVPAIAGIVNGVSIGPAGPVLNVNGQKVALADVVGVGAGR